MGRSPEAPQELCLVSVPTPCAAPELSVRGSWAQPCLVLAPGALLPLAVAPAALMPELCGITLPCKTLSSLHGSGAKGFKCHPSPNHHGSCVGMAEGGCHCSNLFPLPLGAGEAPEGVNVFPDMCLHQCLRSQRLYTGDTANSKQT